MKMKLAVCYYSHRSDEIMSEGTTGSGYSGVYEALFYEPSRILEKVTTFFNSRLSKEQFVIWSSNTSGSMYTAGFLGRKLGIESVKISSLLDCNKNTTGQILSIDEELSSNIETVRSLRAREAIKKVMSHILLAQNIIIVTDASSARHIRDMAKPLNEYAIEQKVEPLGGVLFLEAKLSFDLDPKRNRVELYHDAY